VDNFLYTILITSRVNNYNMKFQDVELTLLELRHNEGISKKTGQPYSIYSLVLGDNEYQRFNTSIGKNLLVEGVIPEWIFKAAEEKTQVLCEIRIQPDGYGCKIIIDDIKENN